MSAKNSATSICHEPGEKNGTPNVRTTIKDIANAAIVQIMAIACFVFIENSTMLTSPALKYYVAFSSSTALSVLFLNKCV
jgi:hypothetical protein